MFLRHLKELFSGKYQVIWIPSFQSINVDLGKDIGHNNVFCPCLKNGNVLWEGIWTTANRFIKSIDCLSHERLLAKLHAYGFLALLH